MVKFRNMNEMPRMVGTSQAGPASYDNTSRPTITFSDVRTIDSISDVQITNDGGYVAEPVSVSGNIVTFLVRTGQNAETAHTHASTGLTATFAGSALAAHQHDVTTVTAAGGGAAMTEPAVAGSLETAGAGQTNTNAVDGASAGTPAGSNTMGGNTASGGAITAGALDEVANATNLSGVTFYSTALGYA